MNEITKKLRDQVMASFMPIAEEMASKGAAKHEIVSVFRSQHRVKMAHYRKSQSRLHPIGDILKNLDVMKADSFTEKVFYDTLVERRIPFKFQYNIGPYRADYLFGEVLVVEIDGPQHDKQRDEVRDKYMRKLGYKIIRVPVWVLCMDVDAVIETIMESLPKAKVLKFNARHKVRKPR